MNTSIIISPQKQAEEVAVITKKQVAPPPIKHNCQVCGKANHPTNQCFFRNSTCHICSKKGHIAKVCRSRAEQSNKFGQKRANFLECEVDNTLFAIYDEPNVSPILVNADVEGVNMKMQLDTGAAVSAISYELYLNNFKNYPLNNSCKLLYLYDGRTIKPEGCCKLQVTFKNQTEILLIYVIKGAATSILNLINT